MMGKTIMSIQTLALLYEGVFSNLISELSHLWTTLNQPHESTKVCLKLL